MEKTTNQEAWQSANEIANEAFGSDYQDALKTLNAERVHAYGCGCGVCIDNYEGHVLDAVYTFYRFQGEDMSEYAAVLTPDKPAYLTDEDIPWNG